MVIIFKKINFLYAGIFVVVIFLLGILLGYVLDSLRVRSIEKDLKTTNAQIEELTAISEVLSKTNNKDCNTSYYLISKMAENTENIANTLNDIENKGMTMSSDYQILKQRYFSYEIRYWLLTEDHRNCENLTTILFFYGNNENSTKEGYVLTSLRNEVQNRVFIFSFDFESNETSVGILKISTK